MDWKWIALFFPAIGTILLIVDQYRTSKLTKLLTWAIILIFWGVTAGMLSIYIGNMGCVIIVVAIAVTVFMLCICYIPNKKLK